MSKKKLLIREVFEQAKIESGKTSKNGLALYLKVHVETFNIFLDEKTFVRYYDAFVLERGKEMTPDVDILDKLSRYIGYNDFADFSRTFVKKDEESNKTTVKISVDKDEESITEKLSNIIINITNEQNFKIPEFMKKNGLGILEMTFVLLMVTGGVFFSNNKNTSLRGLISNPGSLAIEKPFMYWDGERYMATDSSSLGPQIDVIPMDKFRFRYFKKITRPDTLNTTNSMGKVWYDKSNNNVEFFTSYGRHPLNDKALKDVSERILNNYAGQQEYDSIEVE